MAGNRDDNHSGSRRGPPSGGRGAGGPKGGGGKGPRGPRSGAGRQSFSDRPDRPRKDFGDRKPYGARADRPAGDRKFGDKKFGDKPRGPRKEFGDRKPYGDRSERPRKDFSERPRRAYGEDGDRPRKSFSDRPDRSRQDFGERKPYGARADRPAGERKFVDKKFGDKPRGPRKEFGDRKPYGDRSERPRKDFSERPRRAYGEDGERPRKSFSDRPDRSRKDFDDRKPYGARADRPAGERKFGDKKFGDKPRGPRKEFGDRGDRGGWQDHPKSERGGRFEGRRDDRPRGEGERGTFAKRPAFGGRGAYRDRSERDERREEAPKKPKTGERIAKLLARAGLCSRRDAETWVTDGRVSVNGRVITSPALDVTSNDVVLVDGQPLPAPERTRLFMYHKPRGLMTTHADPEGRPTVFDNLPEGLPRLISVGRLDFNTEGLLLLTNDGGLARTLELPDTGWLRRYRVRAYGEITQAKLDTLRDGIEVDGVRYGSIEATLERDQGDNVWILFAIREGKNREVRNVLAHLGLEVNRLIRVSYGPFQLAELAEGAVEEVKARVLREQLGDKIAARAGAELSPPPARPAKPPRAKRETIEDRKGRRVRVERTGSEEARARNEEESAGYGAPRRPQRGYHGKRDRTPKDA